MDLQFHGLRRQLCRLRRPNRVNIPFHGTFQSRQQLTDLLGVAQALLVVRQVILSGRLGQPKLNAVLAAREQPLERPGAKIFDEVVRVLLSHCPVLQLLIGQLEDPDGKLRIVQNLQGPLGGDLSGVIVIITEHQFLSVSAQKPGLLLSQRSAHGGNRVVEPRLMEGYYVDVPLTQNDIGPFGLLRQIQRIELPAFAVYRRFGGVHILRLRVVQHPSAKSNHIPPHVDDGEHQAVSELIVDAAVLVLDRQASGQQLRLRISPVRHGGDQGVPLVQRRSQSESDRRGLSDLPPVQIIPHRPALRLMEHLVIEPGRVPVQIQQALAPASRFPVALFLRDFHVGPFCEEAHRVREGEVFLLHNEVNDAAAFFAAEAIEDLLVRGDGKRPGFLAVERAESE
ncbi:hypothetical protein SDC9_89345 [bioreactor metagenome]|uniref:Uncharacterized protein n=1 Tax=bioreactor metagenome TaxID=1076179 RepID=A0A644ZPI7_9ZZZZ